MNRFFERIARALIYESFGIAYFDGSVSATPGVDLPDEAYRFMVENYPCRKILDVLSYAVTTEFQEGHRWVFLELFDVFRIVLKMQNEEHNRVPGTDP